jgi:hypothetical protein
MTGSLIDLVFGNQKNRNDTDGPKIWFKKPIDTIPILEYHNYKIITQRRK